MAKRSKALTFLSWRGVAWVRIPLETYIFILNSLPPRSEQVSGAHVNHSCIRPEIRLIMQGFVYL